MPIDISLDSILSWSTLSSIVDIIIVSFVVYQLIKIIRGTRINELLNGILIILVVKVVSSVLNLETTEYIIDFIIQWSALALIIIFQPELRRGLEHLGRGSVFAKKRRSNPSEKMIDALASAISYMSKRRIGALISIEGETALDEYIDTGTDVNGDISRELLINIFIPNTPLHDGAVIIKDFKIASAASYLPLSESPAIPKKFGTRHRAAIGLSEQSDAITLIVSEETGEISISHNGNILNGISSEEMVDYLNKHLVNEEDNQEGFFNNLLDRVKKGVSGE
ncbi:DisA bacterial checkpoint controller nucleotide-binding [Alloiococcus otitis]|uniref:Diadenylate cyclase n=1 Tax=Alloiococcus otitis ATCC 51267 TaxID=883081 RepID=K9E937_9LACT|nr:diadenylate cyclase CdaA [Alloiococcus otitis]EKU93218.1 TIGR00159 family protein [Alloiococcus otitis ATCC 51267]SUU80556.1 DisA bacterial checkpoint controller nucleotide-binding [Alloiococcus otitis]